MPIPPQHQKTPLQLRILSLVLAFSFLAAARAELSGVQDYPQTKLRGYGTVTGSLTSSPIDGNPASVLKISSENEEKAKLLQAKFLSDLQLTPGISPLTIQGPMGNVPAYEVKDQGAIAAARGGTTVYIASAHSAKDLTKLITSILTPNQGPLAFAPETTVPMYLDRWDKYGFRFYSVPWITPKSANPKDFASGDQYDFEQEFKYAENHEHIPFEFWARENPVDTAEGLNQDTWWDWETKAAKASNLAFGFKALTDLTATWLYNRYRSETLMKMPQYCGSIHAVADSFFGGRGIFSDASEAGQDAELSQFQAIDKRFINDPNLLSHLEMHNEMHHGPFDILAEYGPIPDASYRVYLTGKYKTLDLLNTTWGKNFVSWNDVRVPEVASFIGWGPEALDLSGAWHVGYEPSADGNATTSDVTRVKPHDIAKGEAPKEWFTEKFDDSTWPQFTAPGSDRTMFLAKRPAVYRRTFEVPAPWLAKHPRVWLDLWDLNRAQKRVVRAYLNGQLIGESPIPPGSTPHIGQYEATKALRSGTNQLSLELPDGIMAYRVYLSPDEPKQYPELGPTLTGVV